MQVDSSVRNLLRALQVQSDFHTEMQKSSERSVAHLEDLRQSILKIFGMPDGYPRCGQCRAPVFDDEQRYSYDDGPTFCAECAPTHQQVLAEAVEHLELADNSEEEMARLLAVIEECRSYITNGGSWQDKVLSEGDAAYRRPEPLSDRDEG